MNGDPATGIEDIVRRNVAALRSKANLTQQALADQMLLRGIAWTRETVAQVETTNRRLGFTEAIVVAACLDVPVARLTATGAATVVVGESEWTAAYLGAAIAGTTGDTFPPESYASPAAGACRPRQLHRRRRPRLHRQWPLRWHGPVRLRPLPYRVRPTAADLVESTRPGPAEELPERRRGERRVAEPEVRAARAARDRQPGPDAAEDGGAHRTSPATAGDGRRRGRHRPTPVVTKPRGGAGTEGDRSGGADRGVAEDHPRTRLAGPRSGDRPRDGTGPRTGGGGSPVGRRGDGGAGRGRGGMGGHPPDIALANKGYNDSDVTRWWNFTRHRELGDRTIAEAWKAAEYGAVRRLVESLPDKHGITNGYYSEE